MAIQWTADSVLDGFEATTLSFPDDYEGQVYATLVRRNTEQSIEGVILYVHGYTDYFFQTHVADEFNKRGYNFYALDLRKYGRSLAESQRPNYCQNVNEYFAEITESINIIKAETPDSDLIVMGHSTGGLVLSLYAGEGEQRRHIKAMILNSPFFDWNLSPPMRIAINGLAGISTLFPFIELNGSTPVPYLQSIYKGEHGEWDYNPAWRPLTGFPIFSGWCGAITNAHKRLRQGLDIHCPVLVMHSDKSLMPDEWQPEVQSADTILNVAHIRNGCQYLGNHVTRVAIEDGVHDLFLSREDVRNHAFSKMFNWLDGAHQIADISDN